jgi:hypothetical protein
MLRAAFFWIFLAVTCGYALWRGRRYERISAGICIVATIISAFGFFVMRRFHPVDYSGLETSDLIVDTFVLVSFVLIALRSDRFWPLWVAGLQLTISMSHLMKAIKPDLLPMAYGAAERFWSYPTLLIIMLAAWRQHQRMVSDRGPAARA